MNIPYDAVEAAHTKLTRDIFKIPRNGCLVLKNKQIYRQLTWPEY